MYNQSNLYVYAVKHICIRVSLYIAPLITYSMCTCWLV